MISCRLATRRPEIPISISQSDQVGTDRRRGDIPGGQSLLFPIIVLAKEGHIALKQYQLFLKEFALYEKVARLLRKLPRLPLDRKGGLLLARLCAPDLGTMKNERLDIVARHDAVSTHKADHVLQRCVDAPGQLRVWNQVSRIELRIGDLNACHGRL
jgi:hypothetical protein